LRCWSTRSAVCMLRTSGSTGRGRCGCSCGVKAPRWPGARSSGCMRQHPDPPRYSRARSVSAQARRRQDPCRGDELAACRPCAGARGCPLLEVAPSGRWGARALAANLGRHTRGVQRVRAAVATPVRCRGALSAAWPVWRGICRKSVGTVADASAPAGPAGRLSTKRSDVSAGHGRVGTRPNDLDEIRVSYGSEGWGFESLRARLQMCGLTCTNLLSPCPSTTSRGCPAVRISYRSCCRWPAKRGHRGDSGVRRLPFGPSCAEASDLLSHLDVRGF
jgi:hypothetical protein